MDAQSGDGTAGTHRWCAFTETGARERNEDRWGIREGRAGLVTWAVADGMGGHDDGDAAAAVGIDAFLDAAAAQEDPELAAHRGMAAAREAVARLRGSDPGSHAPSSTLVGLVIKGRIGIACHAGDSALFLFRRGRLVHRTRDHNVRELKRSVSGQVAGSASEDPDASKLTRSLGDALPGDATDIITRLQLRPGDMLLLCSDGVSQHIPAEEPGAWASGADGEVALLELARRTVEEAGSTRQDNYTAVAIHLGEIGKGGTGPHVLALAACSIAVLLVLGWAWGSGRFDEPETRQASALPEKQVNATDLPTNQRVAPPMPPQAPQAGSAGSSQDWGPRDPGLEAKSCRTVYVSRQDCSTVTRKGTRCRRELERKLEWAHDWPADPNATSREVAEGLCQSQVHDLAAGRFEGECRGKLREVATKCDCEWESELGSAGYCAAHAYATCQPTESCEEVLVPHRECRTVREPREVCEEGTTREDPK